LAKSALDFHDAETSVAGEWFLICVRALAIRAALVALWLVWIVLMIVGMPVSMVMMSLAEDIRQVDQGKTIMVADRAAIAAAHTQSTARRQKNTSSRLGVERVGRVLARIRQRTNQTVLLEGLHCVTDCLLRRVGGIANVESRPLERRTDEPHAANAERRAWS
jgi:hypothetical protein